MISKMLLFSLVKKMRCHSDPSLGMASSGGAVSAPLGQGQSLSLIWFRQGKARAMEAGHYGRAPRLYLPDLPAPFLLLGFAGILPPPTFHPQGNIKIFVL